MDARVTTVDVLGARPQPRGGDQGPGTSSVDGALSEDLLHEAQACKLAQARVQELLLEAARTICPEYCGVWAIPKDAVQPSATAGGGGDLECRAPSTVWRKLLAAARGAPVRITTVSEFGVRREAEYASAADLSPRRPRRAARPPLRRDEGRPGEKPGGGEEDEQVAEEHGEAEEALGARRLPAAGAPQGDGRGLEEGDEPPARVALVRRERGVVEPPVLQVVRRVRPAVPLRGGQAQRDLHPVALRLVVPKHGGRPLPGVRVQANQQAREDRQAQRGGRAPRAPQRPRGRRRGPHPAGARPPRPGSPGAPLPLGPRGPPHPPPQSPRGARLGRLPYTPPEI